MVLEIENTPLYREIQNITTTDNNTPVHFAYYIQIHVGKIIYNPLKLLSIDIISDYENNYADEIQISVAISGGMYAYDIYPYKDQIDITLVRNPIGEVSNANDPSESRQTERYTATLIDTGNPVIEGNGKNTPSKENLDLTSINTVTFQLVNKAIEQFRMISVGGIYRNTTTADVAKAVLTNETKKIKVDGIRMPIGVDMVENTNPIIRDHVVIPHGIRLIDLPAYLHSKCGGIYTAGFGYYMQGLYWYLYPSYDVNRFNSANNKLVVINVPKHKFPSIERTYRKNGKSIVIMATGDVQFRDNTEVMQLNMGNGIRFSDAKNYIDKFGKISDNKIKVSRGANNTEVISNPRANGHNLSVLSSNNINANPYLEYCKLAARSVSLLVLEWENSNYFLISPGTMVKMLYMDNNKLSQIYGVVLKAHTYISLQEKGIVSTRFVSRTTLFLAVKQVKS